MRKRDTLIAKEMFEGCCKVGLSNLRRKVLLGTVFSAAWSVAAIADTTVFQDNAVATINFSKSGVNLYTGVGLGSLSFDESFGPEWSFSGSVGAVVDVSSPGGVLVEEGCAGTTVEGVCVGIPVPEVRWDGFDLGDYGARIDASTTGEVKVGVSASLAPVTMDLQYSAAAGMSIEQQGAFDSNVFSYAPVLSGVLPTFQIANNVPTARFGISGNVAGSLSATICTGSCSSSSLFDFNEPVEDLIEQVAGGSDFSWEGDPLSIEPSCKRGDFYSFCAGFPDLTVANATGSSTVTSTIARAEFNLGALLADLTTIPFSVQDSDSFDIGIGTAGYQYQLNLLTALLELDANLVQSVAINSSCMVEYTFSDAVSILNQGSGIQVQSPTSASAPCGSVLNVSQGATTEVKWNYALNGQVSVNTKLVLQPNGSIQVLGGTGSAFANVDLPDVSGISPCDIIDCSFSVGGNIGPLINVPFETGLGSNEFQLLAFSFDVPFGTFTGGAFMAPINTVAPFVVAPGSTRTVSADLTGRGQIIKEDEGALIFTGNNSFSGSVRVAEGLLTAGSVNALLNVSSISIEAGGELNGGTLGLPFLVAEGDILIEAGGKLSGNAIIGGTVTSAGTIAPGNSLGIVSVANYHALPGASALIEVDLSAQDQLAGITNDLLRITGNSTGVTTLVDVSKLNAERGVATSGLGFELFEVGGLVSPTAFQLSAPVLDGGFQYLLRYVPDFAGSIDGFFLQSELREEMVGTVSMIAGAKVLDRSCFRTDERSSSSRRTEKQVGIWGSLKDGNTKSGASTGTSSDQNFNCWSGGEDVRVSENVRVGVVGGYGDTSMFVDTASGVARLSGEAFQVQGLLSYLGESFFVDMFAGYSQVDWGFKGLVSGGLEARGSGFVGDIELGTSIKFDEVALKLIGALAYNDVSCGTSCLVDEAKEDVSPLLARVTVQAESALFDPSVKGRLAFAYEDVVTGDDKVVLGEAVAISKQAQNLFIAKAGVDADLDDNFSVFADASIVRGIDTDVRETSVSVGAKIHW